MNLDNYLKLKKYMPVIINNIEVYTLSKDQLIDIIDYKYDIENLYHIGLQSRTASFLRWFTDIPISLKKLSMMHQSGPLRIWDLVDCCHNELDENYYVNDLTERGIRRLCRSFDVFSKNRNVHFKTIKLYESMNK